MPALGREWERALTPLSLHGAGQLMIILSVSSLPPSLSFASNPSTQTDPNCAAKANLPLRDTAASCRPQRRATKHLGEGERLSKRATHECGPCHVQCPTIVVVLQLPKGITGRWISIKRFGRPRSPKLRSRRWSVEIDEDTVGGGSSINTHF